MTENYAEIDHRFTYHPTKDDQVTRYVYLREEMKSMAHKIMEACPPGRERAIALTKLEEVNMWCNAAISRNE